MTRALRLTLILGVLAAVAFGAIAMWALQEETSDFAFVPRAAQPTLGVVELQGEENPPPGAGRLYFTTVGVRHATLWETWFGVADGGQLVPEHAVRAPGESDTERMQIDTMAMDSSQDAAEVVGLRALGERVVVTPAGVQIVGIDPEAPIAAAGAALGDVILTAEDRKVTTIESLRTELKAVGAEHTVDLGLHRDGGFLSIAAKTIASSTGAPILGIMPQQAHRIAAARTVTFHVDGVGGPSAGLAFALQIYSAGKDYANLNGHRVAATGTLTMTGTVGPIGGIGEKAIGARRAGADIFLVPRDNADEARAAHVAGLRIIAVENFTGALHALAEAT